MRCTKIIKLGTQPRLNNLGQIKSGVQNLSFFVIIDFKEVDNVSIQDYELRGSMKVYQHKHSILDSVVSFEIVQRVGASWLTVTL